MRGKNLEISDWKKLELFHVIFKSKSKHQSILALARARLTLNWAELCEDNSKHKLHDITTQSHIELFLTK